MSSRMAKGITRRELFKGIGAGAIAGGVMSSRRARAGGGPGGRTTVLGPGPVAVTLTVNGVSHALSIEPRTTLLAALRDQLDLTGAKPVCERGACGACTVHLDGAPINACMVFALDAVGRHITTIEGLAKPGELAPIQRAFIEEDALQCGFCTPGMVMSCAALLAERPQPSRAEAARAVAGNLCRCGTYPKVLDAVTRAARRK